MLGASYEGCCRAAVATLSITRVVRVPAGVSQAVEQSWWLLKAAPVPGPQAVGILSHQHACKGTYAATGLPHSVA